MPRFPVNFRRRSTATDDQNVPAAEPSFRVLDRGEVSTGKTFDGGARLAKLTADVQRPKTSDTMLEDNIFSGLKVNRSGSSIAKTGSDNSSRHSNTSTAPSSTDFTHEDVRNSGRKSALLTANSSPSTPTPKHPGGFLKQAGRTFSFGTSKKHSLPPIPADEPVPAVPDHYTDPYSGRPRADTTSTVSTAIPPKVEDRDFMLDLGGDLSSMLNRFDKRSSVATLKERNLTAGRASHPAPLHLDNSKPVEPPQHSWNSQHSNDGLLAPGRLYASPPPHTESISAPPPPPKRGASPPIGRRPSPEDDEDTILLKSSMAAANQFLSRDEPRNVNPNGRYGRGDMETSKTRAGSSNQDDNLFDKSFGRPPKTLPAVGSRSNNQPKNKVMTPEEFEKYRSDKAQEERMGLVDDEASSKDEDNYEDDDDEVEKSKQAAKQRRRQEAQMSVYRQQMTKVTGESANSSRPGLPVSMSTPNLMISSDQTKGLSPTPPSDGSEEDEEVPLAILAAHGFPAKNRPPTRLSNMPSQPNLRASTQLSYNARPTSAAGETSAAGGRLPPFARKLPQDPYLGAGLINQPPRESFAFGGGASSQNLAVPTGGLVGVIANEERSRAMRRGSPAAFDSKNALPPGMNFPVNGTLPNGMPMNGGIDPVTGIPPSMMYPVGAMTPAMQGSANTTQQMEQFMQMQMQFMQMQMQMMGMQQGQGQLQGPSRPQGHMPTASMGSLGDMSRQSFVGNPMASGFRASTNLEPPRLDAQMRTMSMVQPSSASWIQRPPQPGYAPSIRAQGAGYAPSIAPSERSNIGLPGRYRPVSSIMPASTSERTVTMSSAMPSMLQNSRLHMESNISPITKRNDDDDDDESGWEAMKAKREKKKSLWRSKKSFGSDIGALIS